MSFNRIVRIIIMAIITTSVLTACGVEPAEKETRAEAALARKYGQAFDVLQVYPQKFGDLYYEVQACPVDEPLLRFSAVIDTEDDGVSDTYVERRVCAAISRQAEENLDKLPATYYLFVGAAGPQPITEDKDISIEDYAALDPLNMFRLELFAIPEGRDPAAWYQGMGNLFSGLEALRGNVKLYLVDEKQMDAIQAYFELNDETNFEYLELTKEFFCLEIPYQQGVIGLTEQVFADAVKEVL